jgi:flagellar M-ring protein FliF
MRLSIAVVVNALPENAEGVRPARTEAQLAALEAIVRDAVGFNPNRGDTLTLREAPFLIVDAAPLPEPEGEPFWSAPWFEGLLRQVLLGLALLALVLFVLRPFMKSVMTLPPPKRPAMDDPVMQLNAPTGMASLPAPGGATSAAAMAQAMSAQQSAQMNQWLDDARGLAQEDPRRIAQLTRQWMNTDG